MKRIVVVALLLIFSITVSIFSLVFVKNTCNDTISGIDEILRNAETENKDEVNRLSVQTNRNWMDKKFLLNILIGRTATNEVDKTLNKIIYFSETSDYEAVILNAEDCKEELMYVIESNEPKLSTIF